MALPERMRALQVSEFGGPDVLQVVEVPVPQPKPGHILIKVEASGINFIETYFRKGIYKTPLPVILGNEPAGVVVALSPNPDEDKAADFKIGSRVAAYVSNGAHAEYCLVPIDKTALIPDHLSTRDAASILLQGLTALTLVREAHPVKAGEYALVHAAAGGTGLLLCQILKYLGVHVIGTVSTEDKAELARQNGAEKVVLYHSTPIEQVASQVKALTPGGAGFHVVFDGIGSATFDSAFEVLARKGSLVSFGNASGTVPPFAPLKLASKNIKLTRPTLGNYIATRDEFMHYSEELFALVAGGHVQLKLHEENGYPLSTEGVQRAHSDLEGRKTTGKLYLSILD
ncbi:uncharacterized protein L969DRAFT_92751 [Mixia osmundae IAM 14324]|uniref:Probable quinone oxidoreductase n=1 Tax=Mixia osmundae (strain CBS 9802 / IAM 14324 / JCM 22182 / KY 12970) TaxID=764103 RepID=G7DYG1_MIXOS|nr:uncharacterized protein L969DRAFT_92751 [Mixia osmundae IAM 14324]KEI41523.1 hypothetical protein L969DRAFT_92751 [Mixia osmundae IAM 14324]GAA95621.1 hypothetical protein E5Q_02277 [Mixia osmundae IAM 14324]